MDDVRKPDPQKPPDARNDVKDGTPQIKTHQRRIEHAATAIVDNGYYTTICTLSIRPAKDDTATATDTIHRRIFDVIKEIRHAYRKVIQDGIQRLEEVQWDQEGIRIL